MKHHQTQLIKAQNYEKKQLQEKFELAQQIGTIRGFYTYYFATLSNFDTQKECFNNVNDLYLSVFGEEKYRDYNSFRRRIDNYIKTKK